jgi:hypothetical protein
VENKGYALRYADDVLKNNEEFLYEITKFKNIGPEYDIFLDISPRIQAEIMKDAKYLENFGPCNMKPAKA